MCCLVNAQAGHHRLNVRKKSTSSAGATFFLLGIKISSQIDKRGLCRVGRTLICSENVIQRLSWFAVLTFATHCAQNLCSASVPKRDLNPLDNVDICV